MRAPLITFLMFSQSVFWAQTWNRTMLHLPDTGQESDFTTSPGEDSDYTIFPLSYSLHNDGTLTDEVTGLMWQTQDGGEMTFEEAEAYCDTLTSGGHIDWRLPTALELMSIQDLQQSNPSIDTQAFEDTDAEYWWSSDAQANDPNKIWVTNAGGGIGNHPKTETISAGGTHRFHARAVRIVNAPIQISNRFVVNGNNVILDALTDLMWQQSVPDDTLIWDDALRYADTASFAGYTDWRLPTIKEIHSISQVDLINPSIDPAWSSVDEARKWWSSTTLLNDPLKAWYLYSRFGITTYDAKSIMHHVRLVRGGESTTSVEEITQAGSLFYPMPAEHLLRCNKCTGSVYTVYNTISEKVLQLKGTGPWEIEVLSPGSYFIMDENSRQSYRLLKR